jgi:polyisoprenoid-binding protein YceI
MLKTFFAIVLFTGVSFSQNTAWKFDKNHSQVEFTVTHLVISEVTGYFRTFDGSVKSNGDDFSNAEIEFTIDANSIDTDNEKRDGHLKSDDFFNAEKYPQMKFKSTSMNKVGDNNYKLIGDLTIRDVTKPVELEVIHGGSLVDNYSNKKAGFKISGTINRFDYNLKWNALLEAGGAVVSSDVDLICNVQLVQDPV